MRTRVAFFSIILLFFICNFGKSQNVSVDTINCYLSLRFDTCGEYEFINAYLLLNNNRPFEELPLYDDLTFNKSLFIKYPKFKKKLIAQNKKILSNINNADDYSLIFEKLIENKYMNYSNDSTSTCRFLSSNYFYVHKNDSVKQHPSSYFLIVKSRLVVFKYSNICINDYNQKPIKRPSVKESVTKTWCADYPKVDKGVCNFSILYKVLILEAAKSTDTIELNQFGFIIKQNVALKICAEE